MSSTRIKIKVGSRGKTAGAAETPAQVNPINLLPKFLGGDDHTPSITSAAALGRPAWIYAAAMMSRLRSLRIRSVIARSVLALSSGSSFRKVGIGGGV